ncbi:MAG: TldD/PmbA family protein, partial [Lachnospiraceae bacterium]|nr:TldD/PmbA family protein [Lachnospiraceae bacterium]
EYDCICEPDITGMIVHEAFGHGVEMDMFVKDRAQAKDFIGKQVASELITMHDGACTIPQVATYFFDDEGVPAHNTVIIEKGILKTGICDAQSAMHLGIAGTGNGRRQDTTRKAYTRMTNTIYEAGTSKVEDMIASIKYGFLLCQASSGMEDPKNWGIQIMADMAREIKDGKLTGKVFSPIVMTGYVPDLLKSISMISDQIEAGGTGYCTKGEKELVKVSDGGPYIKARIRLG